MPSFGLLLCCVPLRKKIGLQVVTLLLLLAVHAAAQQEPSFNVHANLVPVPTLVKDGDGISFMGYGLRISLFGVKVANRRFLWMKREKRRRSLELLGLHGVRGESMRFPECAE